MIPSKPATNLEQLHFFELFLAKRNLEPFYTKIYNSFSKKIIYDRSIPQKNYLSKKTIIIKDVPDYLEVEIPNENNSLKIKKSAPMRDMPLIFNLISTSMNTYPKTLEKQADQS